MKAINKLLLLFGLCSLLYSCYRETPSTHSSFMNLGEKKKTDSSIKSVYNASEHEIQERLQKILQISSTIHFGIDISHYQGNVLDEIPSGDSLRFVICKASEGSTYIDSDFHSNWQEIKAKGFIRGAYHFYLCADDPLEQAAHFAATLHHIEAGDIAPIVDIEQGGLAREKNHSQLQKDLLLFLNRLEVLLKRKPIIYTDYGFAQQYLQHPIFSEYQLWLAEYTRASQPKIPDLWKSKGVLIWQKSDSYDIHSQSSDFDVAQGNIQQLIQ